MELPNISLVIAPDGIRPTSYTVWVDDKPWCTTQDDDEGLKLAIAVQKLTCLRNMSEEPRSLKNG